MSNELFRQFLDETMTYSSAWFEDFDEPLETAQLRKIDGILDYAGVGRDRACSRSAAVGARSRSGQPSAAPTSRRSRSRGSRPSSAPSGSRSAVSTTAPSIQICDYRDVEGEYDAIVSVEMIEAVGEEYWPSYFSTIDRHLAPGGKVAIQAIVMSHQRMLETRRLLRLDPEVHLPRRPDPLDPGDRGRLRGATRPCRSPTGASSACTTPRRCAAGAAVPRELGDDRADRLRRGLPPDLGVLPGLLRGRVRLPLPRGLADPACQGG